MGVRHRVSRGAHRQYVALRFPTENERRFPSLSLSSSRLDAPAAAVTTSLLVSLLGQPRIYMTMSRDGLLPPWFSVVHPKRGTPVHATIVTGLTAGTMAFFVDSA